jgi:hypothetical protein
MATGRLDRSAGSEVILRVAAVSVQIQVRLINTDQMSRGSCLGQEHLPNGRRFAFGELLGKAPQVTKGACSWLGSSFVGIPSLRRRSVGPRRTDIHVLTALSRHPCRSAHSASSAFGLHPSRVLWCLSFLRRKIKSVEQINGLPAEAGPTKCTQCICMTGFSREQAIPTDGTGCF